MERTRLYRNGVMEAEGFPIDDVSEYVGDPSAVVWFDLCAPSPADLAKISEELGLHPLAVEDALQSQQRPKLDTYDSHLFLSVYGAKLVDRRLELIEISAFVTKNALVTVRESPRFDIDEVLRRWDANAEMAKYGVPYLLHGLLDYVVDGHFEVLQAMDDRVEALEDDLFEENTGDRAYIQRQTFEMRKKLVRFRRLAVPVREVVGSLLRRSVEVLDPALDPYYQDVYDHTLRVAEWTDSLREMVGNVREAHINQQGFRLNDIMKKITSWAAIIAVPTMITGFYGQNVPYPGFSQPIGFWTSTLVILVASSILYLIFKRRGWL
ncbi:magnesium transporter CorA family protein [Streptosporangium sp. NBC_01639]|uniref:magnesium transporter CorA family protein n=1 Tax=Streptosporangium sp. NBC_01639 TaxID=2975948 RepID=UPI0038655979|nr:magnesium transporter CorA family protein [Streptosporangium sp. NBC_01639]